MAASTDGWPDPERIPADYPLVRVTEIYGVRAYEVIHTARVVGGANRLLSFWAVGVNQSGVGTLTNNSIINLHLAWARSGGRAAGR